MLRHLQKRHKHGSDSDSDGDSDSSHDSHHEDQQDTQADSDSDSESDSSQHDQRIPPSLLKALEHPIIDPNQEKETEADDSESQDTSHSEDSESQKLESRLKIKLFPVCLICPGKQLKTQNLLQEHLNSQAHKRRLERYRDFIQNPPPHTSLSPDPSEVIELIDAIIGPPPVLPSGSITKKQKRKKRKLEKNPQALAKPVPHQDRTSKKKSIPPVSGQAGSEDPAATKVAKRRRTRRGKRERQAKLSKNSPPES